jgi:Fic family protein
VIYQAPPPEEVPSLMAEVVRSLEAEDAAGAPPVVRAAMAHLHLVSIHPFRDGNGRAARILQSLVLAREGLLSPEFASIEEYLGRHTDGYYRVLQEVQGGRYQPERSAEPWIVFCVEAHLNQARRRLDQIERAAARWGRLEDLVIERGWPDRLVIALEQALIGGTDRARYGSEADISPATASGDLRRLLDADLLGQRGRGRSTRYFASERLRRLAGGRVDD